VGTLILACVDVSMHGCCPDGVRDSGWSLTPGGDVQVLRRVSVPPALPPPGDVLHHDGRVLVSGLSTAPVLRRPQAVSGRPQRAALYRLDSGEVRGRILIVRQLHCVRQGIPGAGGGAQEARAPHASTLSCGSSVGHALGLGHSDSPAPAPGTAAHRQAARRPRDVDDHGIRPGR
jgi:hypothetical protein